MGSDYISRYTKVVSDSIFLNTYVKMVWIHLILQLGVVATKVVSEERPFYLKYKVC